MKNTPEDARKLRVRINAQAKKGDWKVPESLQSLIVKKRERRKSKT